MEDSLFFVLFLQLTAIANKGHGTAQINFVGMYNFVSFSIFFLLKNKNFNELYSQLLLLLTRCLIVN